MPVVAAVYSLAERGLTKFATGTGSVVLVVSTAFRLRDDAMPVGRLFGSETLSTIALIAAAIALGYAVATHRRLIAEQSEVIRLQTDRLQENAKFHRQRERLELSRDLHDTMGHSLSVITLHANVGLEALGSTDGDGARVRALGAFEQVRATAHDSLSDLRAMVRLLRTGEPRPTTAIGLDGIPALLDQARASGLRVDARIDIAAGELPSPVEMVVFRIVQEGLTNVLRHACPTAAEVVVRNSDEFVHVTTAHREGFRLDVELPRRLEG